LPVTVNEAMDSRTINPEILPENYRFLQEHVRTRVGIVLEDNKHYLFESRLAPILKQHGLSSINELCGLLRAKCNASLDREVLEAMTTNETYFFRDPGQYEAIRTTLMPRWKDAKRDTRKLRIWSAASSTGQEAYTLALILLENGFVDWNIEILGTDFSDKVVERARVGVYQQIEVNRGLPAALLVKYFRRLGLEWQLREHVRKMVRFQTIDLRKSMRALGPFDLVFCRNVMIYFEDETKRKIMKEIHRTMFRGAWLFLGGAETAVGIEEMFQKQAVGSVTVYVAQ
jgi:chemotaxis protein methyltransferase CheR